MRIVQIIPGVADSFYCENCVRDAALVTAMQKLGHDVLVVPIYLPLRIDSNNVVDSSPIFFGGINVYLQQKSTFFQKTPRWMDCLFDWPPLLRWVGRRAAMTSAGSLGEMTISMLLGQQGRQVKELNRLIKWLRRQENKPDIVCLSNALLSGLARSVKKMLNVPVVCLLQDEDGFLDGLLPPYSKQAWQILSERCRDVDGFIAVSNYYADVMRQRLGLGKEQVHVIYMGISLDGYESLRAAPETPTIGYLSRMCFDRGLDTLVDAFIRLKKNEKMKNLKLRVAGGRTDNDGAFINRIRLQIQSCGFIDDVEFLPGFDRDTKPAFFKTLSLLSVPEKRPIACGLYVLEALAAAVPVVVPASGAFPELLEITGGGILCGANNAEALAAAMKRLLLQPDDAGQLGRQGRNAVFGKFNVDQTAREMVRIYAMIIRQS